MNKPLIIIGAGLAGWTTAREFRKLDTTTPVVVVTADSGDFYAKPSLSNAFAQGKLPEQLVSTPAAKMAETLNVTLLSQTRVQSIDTAAKALSVESASGKASLAYGQLVLATGAQPIRVPVEGNAANEVMSVNSLQDFVVFHAELVAGNAPAGGRHVLIMGAGLIGCEFANDLAKAGYRVSVVDPGQRPLAALLPESASQDLQAALEALGVSFYFGTTVKSVNVAADAAGSLNITLANGDTVMADKVLSAVGLRADTTLAAAAGIQVERAIVVDTHLETTAKDVYAVGDSAQYASAASALSEHGSALPYVMPIMTAAKALALTLTGNPTPVVFPLMPVSIKTPALPLVVASPKQGATGQWNALEAGIWHWLDEAGTQRGFVLTGSQTAQRMAQSKLVVL